MRRTTSSNGFTLVELSIVLVILGLLVGGILSGQSLIRASELRSVSNDISRYTTAVHSFRDKYFALPGDMANATKFWGDDATATIGCADAAVPNGTPGTCNGNGDAQIFLGSTGSVNGGTAEGYQAWKQLALARLLEGAYTGYAADNKTNNASRGVNVPAAKIARAGWSLVYTGPLAGDTNLYDGDYGNTLALGSNDASQNDYMNDEVLKASEQWNIDTKLDDGKPASGTLRAFKPAARPYCANTATPPEYLVNDTRIGCNLVVITKF